MGFEPSLSRDTYFLLLDEAIVPIQFVGPDMRKASRREIVRPGNHETMWAVREIAHDTLAVGYRSCGYFDVFMGNTKVKSVFLGLKIFDLIIPKT